MVDCTVELSNNSHSFEVGISIKGIEVALKNVKTELVLILRRERMQNEVHIIHTQSNAQNMHTLIYTHVCIHTQIRT